MAQSEVSVPEAGPGPAPPATWAARASGGPPSAGNERIRLQRGGALLLETDGFRILASRGFQRSVHHAYDALTHLATTGKALLIGTDAGLHIIQARDFAAAEVGPEEARERLLARLDGRLEGAETRRRIERLEAFSDEPARPFAVWGVIALCMIAAILQLRDEMMEPFAAFVPELFVRGEHWRAVTGQLLHGNPRLPIHLAMNVAGLAVLGYSVERPLGTPRTLIVLALGAAGTVIGSIHAGYELVIGASGLVFGLAGAMLALELHYPEALPVYWRMPRRVFIGALLLQFGVIDQLVPFLAGEAHLGGFIGGYAGGFLVGAPRLDGNEPGRLTMASAMTVLALTLAAIVTAVPLLQHDMGALERHALRLLNSPAVRNVEAVQHDNAVAWFIATEGEPTPVALDLAVALADRAVGATARQNPNLLDTLAEALFQADRRLDALLTIDEAIVLAPGVSYFEEQRRRFTGERAADDRPAPPGAESPPGDSPGPSTESSPDPADPFSELEGGEEPGIVL